MNLFRRKRRFPALVMAAVMLLFTWDVPVEAEETEAVETEEMAEAEETVSYGSPENGEDYDFSGIAPLYEEAETADRYFGFAEENVFQGKGNHAPDRFGGSYQKTGGMDGSGYGRWGNYTAVCV